MRQPALLASGTDRPALTVEDHDDVDRPELGIAGQAPAQPETNRQRRAQEQKQDRAGGDSEPRPRPRPRRGRRRRRQAQAFLESKARRTLSRSSSIWTGLVM